MAALCSYAWCNYPNFPISALVKVLAETYEIKFWDPNLTPPAWVPIKISNELLLEESDKSPVFARPTAAPNYEVWPAIYEKAYAKFIKLPDSPKEFRGKEANRPYPRPDISAFPLGNPLVSLVHLTGLKYTLNSTYFNTKPFYSDRPGSSFTTIYNATNKNTVNGIEHGITKYPMVAWTYLNETEANKDYSGNPFQVRYSNEIIVGNHAYSILGIVKTTSNNYVVLRNPYGKLWGADPGDPVISPYLYTGTWSPPGFSKSLTTSDPYNDGIFALDPARFERYFTAFGWVQ